MSHSASDFLRSVFRCSPCLRFALGGAVPLFAAATSSAATITVGNPSFETPDISFVSTYAQMPFLPWDVTETSPGQQVGQFDNTSTPGPFIDNAPGGQVAFMLTGPGITLFQNVTAADAIFSIGQSYTLTVGAGASTGNNSDAQLQLRLYYLVGSVKTTVKTFTTNFNLSQNPNGITHLFDVNVTSDVVKATDPWAGKQIGIEFATPGTPNANSGYWDLDNVRLTSIPEPSALPLSALAGAGLALRRRRGTRVGSGDGAWA